MTGRIRQHHTAAGYISDVIQQRPELRLKQQPGDASPITWPLYAYGHSAQAGDIWAQMAQNKQVRLLADIQVLQGVRTGLNARSCDAVSSGIIWVQKEREFTSRERTLGVTFHPAIARENVYLITPQQWHELLFYVFPQPVDEDYTPHMMITYTVAWDQADYTDTNLTPLMRRGVLMQRRGIESGQPQNTSIQQNAFRVVSLEVMERYHVIPVRINEQRGELTMFMSDVDDTVVRDLVHRSSRLTVVPIYMEPDDEAAFWRQYNGATEELESESDHDRALKLFDIS